MKETAVEWLEFRYKNNINLMDYDFEQAKEMEKQQIIEARQDGYESTYNSCESGCMGKQILGGNNEQYYNETFKNQLQG